MTTGAARPARWNWGDVAEGTVLGAARSIAGPLRDVEGSNRLGERERLDGEAGAARERDEPDAQGLERAVVRAAAGVRSRAQARSASTRRNSPSDHAWKGQPPG